MRAVVVLSAAVALGAVLGAAQQPSSPGRSTAAGVESTRETPLTPEQLKAAIDRLGTVDYAARTAAARAIRRAPVGCRWCRP